MSKMTAEEFLSPTHKKPKSKEVGQMSADEFLSMSTKDYNDRVNKDLSDGSKEILSNTLKSVTNPTAELMKPINFKEAVKQSKIEPKQESKLQGKLPAASLLNGDNSKPLQTSLNGKLPASSLITSTGGGPANADKIPGVSQYEINKKEIANDNAPKAVKAFANTMNYVTEGNPLGIAIGNAFSGNSGATLKDSSGNKTVDKISDVVNNFVTPILTPTGAPVGQGTIGSTYGAAEKVLSTKAGNKLTNYAANSLLRQSLIPKGSAEIANTVARVGLTEGIAGAGQGAGIGVQQGQDTVAEIERNAKIGAVGGAVLGGAGAIAGETPFLSNLFRKNGLSEAEIAEIAPTLALPEGRGTVRQSEAAGRSNLENGTEPITLPYDDIKHQQSVIDEYKRLKSDPNVDLPIKKTYELAQKNVESNLNDIKINGESTYKEPKIPQKMTREQEVNNRVLAGGELSQEDIDFLLSPEYNPNNLNPESDVKPPVKEEVAATTETQIKPTNNTIITEVKKSTSKQIGKVKGERGFYQTLKASRKAPEAVERMNPKYDPITNQGSLDVANNRIKDLEKAKNDILSNKVGTNADSIATAQRLVQEYTKMGDHETAALIAGKAASDLTTAGQTIQAASMWNRLSAEGMLLRVQQEIAKVNETLSPMEEKLSLSTADAAKITNTGQAFEKAQSVRDLSEEVINMVNSKVPGTQLNAEEKALIAKFEQKVKSVNDSVKPFLKAAKSEVEKIEKIKPENRTRDQVVSYMEAKAQKAQERIARRSNIGIVAELNNPVIDYSIIAAAKIARGIRDFSDLTEEMIRTVGPAYKEHADEVFVKATNRFRKESGLPSTTQLERVINAATKDFDITTAKNLRRMAAEIGYYTDENIKRELTQDLQEVMKTYGKATVGEKVAGIQTAAQLVSVPTFLRNTLGNAGQFALEKINKVSAVPIDWTLSKFTGERTIQFLPKNQEKMWKNFASGTDSGWRGVNSMGTLDSYNVKPNVFGDKNPLKYLSKITGASLQGMDYAAYRAAYGDVMATYAEQMGKAQGMSGAQIKERMPELLLQLDETVRGIADQAGKYATYQDETMLSKAAQGTKKALNFPTDYVAKKAVETGVIKQSMSWEGFGLGDVVLKYAKTPANLVMRGIDYSPLGFIRAIGEFAPLMKSSKEFNQFQATRALSRAITGTVGLSATGYILADAGILTGASSSDPDKRSIEDQSGKGAYKANLSGLYRWLTSGFDKKEAQYRQGDQMMDYAWIQPAAVSLGMGVNFRLAKDPKKVGEQVSNTELAKRSIIGGLRTVLENPMVSGLSDVIGGVSDLVTRQDDKKLKGIVKGIPSSFVPAVLGQARNATDNKQRETFDPSLLKEMVNLVKNRVPGLSKQLPIAYDSLGKPRERIQGGQENTLGQYLNSFINPTKFTNYTVSPEAQIVLDVLNGSKDNSVLPRIGQRTIQVTNPDTKQKETIKLTNEQFSKLQQEMGLEVAEEIRKKQDYLTSSDHTMEKKAKKIKDILSEVGKDVKNNLRVEMGYKKLK